MMITFPFLASNDDDDKTFEENKKVFSLQTNRPGKIDMDYCKSLKEFGQFSHAQNY